MVSPWSADQILRLEPLWTLCQGRRDAHTCSCTFYGRWHKLFTFPSVLVGSILSTVTLNSDNYHAAVASSMSIFMTLLATTNTFFNFAERTEGHRNTHRGFTLLLREMEMCILRAQTIPKREYEDFLEYVNDKFTELIESAPALHADGRRILEEVRRSRPSPFDTLRSEQDTPSVSAHDSGNSHEVSQV